MIEALIERDGWVMPEAVNPVSFAQWQGEARERLDLAMPHVRKRGTVVQAGGNLGIWPRLLAVDYGFEQVLTFEPDPVNFQCLIRNVVGLSCNRRTIHCHCRALGRRSGEVVSWSRATAERPGWHRVAGGGFLGRDSVEVTSIDEERPPLDCDLLALDVEGYELEALKGATRTVERFHPVVIIEDLGRSRFASFRRRSTVAFGHKPGSVQGWLKKRGYRMAAEIRNDEIWVS